MLRTLLILACLLATSAQAQRTDLIGSSFGLEGWLKEYPSDRTSVVRVPGRAIVQNPGVEFPRVERLFDTPEARRLIREGKLSRFVNTWIDVGPNWIEIDFDRAGRGQFSSKHLNAYVFVFEKSSPIRVENARIDGRTTLPLRGRIWSQGNRLIVNVQGIPYSSRDFVRITFDVAPALGAGRDTPSPTIGAGESRPQPRPSAAPQEAPIPEPAPGGLAGG